MDEIARIAKELALAVELTMDPRVPQQQRMEAYTACERFKETSPVCVQCGLYLAQQSNASHFVRHFGLQLMEHCVKYRWNQISQQEKLFIKVKSDCTRVTYIQKVGPFAVIWWVSTLTIQCLDCGYLNPSPFHSMLGETAIWQSILTCHLMDVSTNYSWSLWHESHNSTLESRLWFYKCYFFIVHHVALFVLYTFIILHGIIPEDSNSH